MLRINGSLETDKDGGLGYASTEATITGSAWAGLAAGSYETDPGMISNDSHQSVWPCQRSMRIR